MRKAYLIVILLMLLFTITGCDKRSDFEISIVSVTSIPSNQNILTECSSTLECPL